MEDGTHESFEWRGMLLRPGRNWDFDSRELLEHDGGDRHQYGERLSIGVWERWLTEGLVDQAEIQDAWQAMDWPNDPNNALDKEQWIALFRDARFAVPTEPITVYRAEVGPEGAVGLAWSDSLGQADMWAVRQQDVRSRHVRCRILKAVTQPGEILAVFGTDGTQRLDIDGVWVDVRNAEIIATPSEVEEVGQNPR